MTNRFMISVAALALIAGTGMANAQGMGKESPGASGGTMQHAAPGGTSAAPSQSDSSAGTARSESSEPSKGGASKGDMKSTQSEKSPGAMKNQSAQDNARDNLKDKSGTTTQRAEDRAKGSDIKGSDTNQRAEDRAKGGDRNNMNAEGRDSKSGTNTNAAEGKSSTSTTTTGQAGAGAKLTSDQRTKITSVIHNQRVESVKNVNFSITVGTRVPREGVRFYPLPAEVVTIYPQWRGYEFIVVNERIVIIDPHSYEIVEIIES